METISDKKLALVNTTDAAALSDLHDMISDQYELLYRATAEAKHLGDCLQHAQLACSVTPRHCRRLVVREMILNRRLILLYERNDLRETLDEAHASAEIACSSIDRSIADNEDVSEIYYSHSIVLQARYDTYGEVLDLETALKSAQRSFDLTTAAHPAYAFRLWNLANLLESKYKIFGKIHDINDAIQHNERALLLLDGDCILQASIQCSLGDKFESRYIFTSDKGDLERAVDNGREAHTTTDHKCLDFPDITRSLVSKLSRNYDCTSSKADLLEAQKLIEFVPQCSKLDGATHTSWLATSAVIMVQIYDLYGQIKWLETARDHIHRAIIQTPDHHVKIASRLKLASDIEHRKYVASSDLEPLRKAISLAEKALALTNTEHMDWKRCLALVATRYYQFYKATSKETYLEDAILRMNKAVKLASKEPILNSTLLDIFSNMLHSRYRLYEEQADLVNAITNCQRAMELTSIGDMNYPFRLDNLASKLASRAQMTGNIEDLRKATELAGEALERTPPKYHLRHARLRNLANRLYDQFEYDSNSATLDLAIQRIRQALDLIFSGHADHPKLLKRLSTMLERRYRFKSCPEDLEEAVKVSSLALSEVEALALQPLIYLDNMGTLYELRYSETKDLRDLYHSVDLQERAFVLAKPEKAHQLEYLTSFCRGLLSLSLETGDCSMLHKASSLIQEAAKETAFDATDYAIRKSTLSSALLFVHEQSGGEDELAMAVRLATDALERPSTRLRDRGAILNNASTVFVAAYSRWNQLAYLEKAIALVEQSIDLEPVDPSLRNDGLHNLANYLSMRFDRQGNEADLDRALELSELAAAGGDAQRSAGYLGGIADRLEKLSKPTKDHQKLDSAIKASRKALELTPCGDLEIPNRLHNLSTKLALRYLYQKKEHVADFVEAANLSKEALELAREDDPQRAKYLFTHAKMTSLYAWVDRGCAREQIRKGLPLYREALETRNATLIDRLRAAIEALSFAKMIGDVGEGLKIALAAMRLLIDADLRSLDRPDQQYVISHLPNLAVDACGQILCDCDDDHSHAELGLSILELGRGIMLGLVLDQSEAAEFPINETFLQSDSLFKSQAMSPIADTACGVSSRDSPFGNPMSCASRECISKPFHDLIASAAKLGLRDIAKEGPVITVCVTPFISSYAIIVTSTGVKKLDLPNMFWDETDDWLDKRLTRREGYDPRSERTSMNKVYRKFLAWLWDTCVEPILSGYLGFGACQDVALLPRIFWIGAGLASTLPFHAAGRHEPGSARNTMSVAVSSYAATLRLLRFAQEQSAKTMHQNSGCPQLLTVAMPTTPGDYEPLGEVDKEIEAVKHSTGLPTVHRTHPQSEEVSGLLREMDAVHFACHGFADERDPSRSSLIFQKSNAHGSELIEDHLTVDRIANVRAKRGRLAFLSACSTAENSSQKLRDEAIHLASSFQVAGYSHVVATMWSAPDLICVAAARIFYQMLGRVPWHDVKDRDIAQSLHQTVWKIKMMDRKWALPLQWAQYVHFGA